MSLAYGYTIQDRVGTHSIDKLIVDYKLSCSHDDAFRSCFLAVERVDPSWSYQPDKTQDGYNGFLDSRPCSRFSWFTSGFWFDHVNLKSGFFQRKVLTKTWELVNKIRLEFNPNKCFDDIRFKALMTALLPLVDWGQVVECDYTVDIDTPLQRILCLSKKDRITVGLNRYYGKRHSNGRIKIYNKAKELREVQKLPFEGELSRCELTCREGECVSFDDVKLLAYNSIYKIADLSANLRTIYALITLLQLHGEDGEELLRNFVPDKRNRDKLIPFVLGDVCIDVFSKSVFTDLLTMYADEFRFNWCFNSSGGYFQHRVWNYDEVI